MTVKEYIEILEKFPSEMQILFAGEELVLDMHLPESGFFVEIPNERVHSTIYTEISEVEYEDWKLDPNTLEHETPFEPFRALLL